MRTLHRIYNDKLFKKFAIIFCVSVTFFILGKFTSKFKDDSEFISLFNELCFVVAAVGPLATFFCNNSFPHNVKFLINQHFNRVELLKYFFFTQTLKLILVMINYSTLGGIKFFYSDMNLKEVKFPSLKNVFFDYFLFSDYFLHFVIFLTAAYVFYPVALFGANKADLQKVRASKTSNKKNIKMSYALVAFVLTAFYVISNYSVPHVLKGYLFSLFIVFTSLIVLNRTFKFSHQKKAYPLAGVWSFIICLPLVGIIYGMRLETLDRDVSFKARGDSVVYLDWMAPRFSENEMLGFLKESDRGNYNSLLHLFGNQVNFEKSLSFVKTEYRARKFIDFHSKKHPEETVKKVISHMSNLMETNKYNFSFAQYGHSFLKHQEVSAAYIEELVRSKSPYKQLAAMYFAKNSFRKDELIGFYKLHLTLLDRSVVNDRYVRRSIASEGEAKE